MTPGSFAISLTRPQWRLMLSCFSIAANALSAGGIFIFPLLSPVLASHLKFSQPQLTSIALAGMIGQYLFSPFIGKIYDCYGPQACSFLASILFTLGFGLFSREISRTPDTIAAPRQSSFHLLVILFFMCGIAAVLSFFSSIFTATMSFPRYPGVASGVSLALFGLSPLCLSLAASHFFTTHESGLDVTRFLNFVALLAGSIHLFGAITLRIPKHTSDPYRPPGSDTEQYTSERTPLLEPDEHKPPPQDQRPVAELLHDASFWILFPVIGITLGLCEMVISNMGSIVLSLPSQFSTPGVPPVDTATSTQVRMFATANTVSRLVIGPIADSISPMVSSDARGTRLSRVYIMSATVLLLFLIFAWMDVGVRSQEALWFLSIGVGTVYGITWTILPSILSSVWGSPDLGRNFGIVSYAPVIGTPVFSYLYAFVSDHYARGGICRGTVCWHLTFLLASIVALIAFCCTLTLRIRWKRPV